MSVASPPSFPCIKPRTPSSPPPSSSSSSSSYSPSSSSSSSSPTFKFTIRSSQAEGPFRRPVAPSPVKPVPPSPPPKTAAVQDKNVITLEFLRQKAKELQEYFKQKKLEDANQGPFFGFIGKNEISNGRLREFFIR